MNNVQMAPGIEAKNIVILIVYLVLILVAAYFLTKFVAKRSLQKGMKRSQTSRKTGSAKKYEPGRHVCVVDRIAVERDKTLMVVEFQGKYYLLSTTSQEIHCIDKIEIPPEEPVEMENNEGEAEESEQKNPAASYDVEGDFFAVFKTAFIEKTGLFFSKVRRSKFVRLFARKNKSSFEEQLRQTLESADSVETKSEFEQVGEEAEKVTKKKP